MGIFRMPKTLCYQINQMMQIFFWSHKENDHKIHWLSWPEEYDCLKKKTEVWDSRI